MQLFCSAPAREQFAHLEQLHRKLPSLSEIFAAWSSRSTGAWSDALALREHLLGAATLSSGSLRLLYLAWLATTCRQGVFDQSCHLLFREGICDAGWHGLAVTLPEG